MYVKLIAIIPSAGIGKRFGSEKNKIFHDLEGKPIIIRTLEAIQAIPQVSEIIPVFRGLDIEYASKLLSQFHIPKVKRIAPGGKERQDSVFHGLKQITESDCYVLVHDGARPLFDPKSVSEVINELNDCDGIVFGTPAKETLKEVKGSFVERTLSRKSIWNIQTPQIFSFKTLMDAYSRALKDGFYSTDDAALIEKNGGKVKVVQGSSLNIKITTPDDLLIAASLLREGQVS